MQTIAVTGGNGRIGSAVLEELNQHGYDTVNLDRDTQSGGIADRYLRTDLLDPGNVYGALARSEADAVVHMGTIPAPTSHPGYVTYESNVMSSYHVLEAATELRLESVCLASSINAMGSVYQDAPMDVRYLPVDESHPLTPRDPYAIGKQTLEITADGFGRMDDTPRTISTLRYPWVAYEHELREQFVNADRSLEALEKANPHSTRDVLFSYIHIEDAASIAREAVTAGFEGHETFWAVAADTTASTHSDRLCEEFYPDAEQREPLGETESLISIDKARRLLDWTPDHSWRTLDE